MMLRLEERLKGIEKCWMYLFLREYNVHGTVERSGSTNPLGHPLQWCLNIGIVPSKLCWKALDLRNWMASPFTKPFYTPLYRGEKRRSEDTGRCHGSGVEMDLNIEDTGFSKSVSLVYRPLCPGTQYCLWRWSM